ncbi:hypothetical protein AZI86_13855 [Bdellovibrio bacteriovorus]|uniref:HTH merR-type domain-containing protein n=1 Tax=Bdellovibrio bacteriovorus TaxID=959 RepID=A0A150WJD2_BDEBC|nr:MerR family transcriptional regulator [Bdellovibrio bacteriovorus]KYG63897.1 hypothetical protein AZI86_13855 [Bdellovibrio bacteriovorus]
MRQKSFPKTFKISEFSKKTGLSIKALRLYEERGLLIPKRNPLNGYRIYSEAQINEAERIMELRRGFKFRKKISDSILKLSSKEILDKTRDIPSTEYLRTLLLVETKAQKKFLSVLSEKARKLVKEDLLKLQTHFEKFW